LTNLLVAVNNYTEKGRCLSNSFTEVGDLFRKNGISTNEMPFTLDQIKTNMDKNRYKRLDRFQDDVFALFGRVRTITRPDSQLFLDSIDLQKFFISKREELCKGVLVSPASTFTESDLWDEIEARKKAIKKEGSPAGSATNEVDSDADPSKVVMEVDEPEKPKAKFYTFIKTYKHFQGSEEVLESAEFEGTTYKPTDYVYVAPGEDSAPNDTQRHIFRIESIVRDSDNKDVLLIKGIWVFRPSETYHLSKRKFYEKVTF
jgi:protein polybromo-1